VQGSFKSADYVLKARGGCSNWRRRLVVHGLYEFKQNSSKKFASLVLFETRVQKFASLVSNKTRLANF